ncbi:MAG: outer membrane protein assembly factor BamD [Verrucomicrobiae bacterium]|nr:outer membrane protein assembly factor BamD [Verrucomicrobiae bacterium]MCP5521261.1 outer membrane protein assembly factor BamD [Verrucomicrobiales bacterium]
MKRAAALLLATVLGLLLLPVRTPAPLVYVPGEGWTYETPGSAKWQRARAEDQLKVARDAYDEGRFKLATKAAKRVVSRWPNSDFAPDAQYLVGQSYELRTRDERAFKEYQKLVERYPKYDQFDTVLVHQFEIANRFLAGQKFRLWGLIRLYRSMEKTAEMYSKIIRNGQYSRIAPQAQLNIGVAREKQKDYYLAVRAYEKAADLYADNPVMAPEALYRAGMAWYKQAKTSEYDQSAAGSAIDTFTDFIILYPADPRVPELRDYIASMKEEQARGALRIARYYDKRHKLDGAKVYYNEVLRLDSTSEYAETARQRLAALKAKEAKAGGSNN